MSRIFGFLVAGMFFWTAVARNCQAAEVCADGATLDGIDVSLFTGEINWSGVAADGIVFAYIRVANGLTADSKFSDNWSGARQAGVVRGAYQILQPSDDAVAQAQVLVNAIGELSTGDLPPALAVEVIDGQTPGTIATKVGAWLSYVESALGLPGIIYTGRFFWQDNVASSDYADHPLWIADYSSPTCPNLPSQWTDWVLWQNSSTGVVDGITGSVDTDIFNGDLSALKALGKPGPCGLEPCPLIFEDDFELLVPP